MSRMELSHVLIFSCLLIGSVQGQMKELKIGALFTKNEKMEERVFNHAIDVANSKLSQDGYPVFNITGVAEEFPDGNCFSASKIVCKFLSEGVIGIFGPSSSDCTSQIQSLCDMKGIPNIKATWDSRQKRDDFMINLFPHSGSYGTVLEDLVNAWEWTNCTLVYEDNESLIRLTKLLKMSNPSGLTITVHQLSSDGDHRQMFRDIRDAGEKNIVLDCSADILEDVLTQSLQVGTLTNEYSYIITSLDLHTLNLEPFKYSSTNITGIRLAYNEQNKLEIASSWPAPGLERGVDINTIKSTDALLYDAVLLFVDGLNKLDIENLEIPQLSCQSNDAWHEGPTLFNFIKGDDTKLDGLTGPIYFDHQGFHSEFNLEVIELTEDGIDVVGTWSFSQGLHIRRKIRPEPEDDNIDSLRKGTVIVLTAISPPYGMLKASSDALEGNDKYEGFGIDIIQEIATMLKFNYTFKIQEDNIYSSYNETTKEWGGMLREVNDRRADLAITDLSITSRREEYVDFTTPFMDLGISILYKKATKKPPGTFSFMEPFSVDVWMCVFSVYIGVSLLLYIMGRICPYEWNNPYPCIEEPEELENQFSLNNSMWFTIGSLMQQGSEIAPIGVSTRMVASMWWFFTLIMVSSYTANLAAFLTIEKPDAKFTDAESLANHPQMMYGAKKKGATLDFFKNAQTILYDRMYEFMMAHENEVQTSDNNEGVKKVKREENFAFLMESSSIEYVIERNCDLDMYGEPLDSKGYGIAMRKNMPYYKELTNAVLELKEHGVIQKLRTKWWKEKGGGQCRDDSSASPTEGLNLQNLGGVFIVLVVGVVISIVIAILELLWNTWKVASKENVSFRHELMDELKFILRFKGCTKPVKKYNQDGDENMNQEDTGINNFETTVPYGFKVPFT